MVVQMDWMHARWEREASLRKDSAYAKKFLQLQLNVAKAWYVVSPSPPLFPPFFKFLYANQLSSSCTATKPSFVSSSTSARTSSTAESPWSSPSHSPPRRPRQRSSRSSSWRASSPARASLPVIGPPRRPSTRSSALRPRRSAVRSAPSSSWLSLSMPIKHVPLFYMPCACIHSSLTRLLDGEGEVKTSSIYLLNSLSLFHILSWLLHHS